MSEKYDANKTKLLIEWREKANVTQQEAAEYFGLSPSKGRDEIRSWEYGRSAPKMHRRRKFIWYLWDKLGLKDEREEMERIWNDVMVGEWRWRPLRENEYPTPAQAHFVKEKGETYPITPFQVLPPSSLFRARPATINALAAYIREMVEAGTVALCSIWGMSGVGKTYVAHAVAQEVRDLFPDGQLLLALKGEGLSDLPFEQPLDSIEAMKSVIQTLMPTIKLPDTETELVHLYHSVLANRRVLIVADNAQDNAQIQALIPPTGCALLVTSRTFINVDDMNSIHLDSLDPEPAKALLLNLSPRTGVHAPELAKLCGFLPFALRIVSSILETPPRPNPAVFVKELHDDPLAYLVRDEDNPDDPTGSVEALLRRAFNTLDEDTQQVMLQLCVFPASFDSEAALAVVQGLKVVKRLLRKLHRRSMLEWQEATDRYILHDLMRRFCLKHLPDLDTVQLRHAQHFAKVAGTAEALYTREDTFGALALFDRERAHIDAGWLWAQSHAGNAPADTLLIAYGDGTRRIGGLRYDRRQERIPQMQAMLEVAQRLGQRDAEGRALHYLGNTLYLLGEIDAAATHLQEALVIAREVGAATEITDVTSELGLVDLNKEDIHQAIRRFEESINLARSSNYEVGEVVALCNLGRAYNKLKQPDQALSCLLDALDRSRAIGSKFHESAALTFLGDLYRDLHDTQRAIMCYEQSLDIDRGLGDKDGEANASLALADLLADRDPQRACVLWRVAYDYAHGIGHPIAFEIKAKIDSQCRGMNQDK